MLDPVQPLEYETGLLLAPRTVVQSNDRLHPLQKCHHLYPRWCRLPRQPFQKQEEIRINEGN